MGVDEQMVRGPRYRPGRFAKVLAELDTIIVDEASMVRADLSDAMVAALERFGPRPGEPFGDTQLVDLLNAVREGALLDEARAQLNRHTVPDFEPDLDEYWLTLATTNRIVRARNRAMLARITEHPTVFEATVSGEIDGFEHPTDDTLHLAVGAQVMLLKRSLAVPSPRGSSTSRPAGALPSTESSCAAGTPHHAPDQQCGL